MPMLLASLSPLAMTTVKMAARTEKTTQSPTPVWVRLDAALKARWRSTHRATVVQAQSAPDRVNRYSGRKWAPPDSDVTAKNIEIEIEFP